jgi:hypothetical protein
MTRRLLPPRPLAALAALAVLGVVALAACGRDRDTDVAQAGDPAPPATEPALTARRDTAVAADGDVLITSRGGEVELGLLGERVVMRLADAQLAKVRRDLDTAGAGAKRGLGGMIERTVKGSVQSMLAKQIEVPVNQVEDVRYEGGEIRFRLKHDPVVSFNSVKVNKQNALSSFAPADAERFVAAVRARKEQQ